MMKISEIIKPVEIGTMGVASGSVLPFPFFCLLLFFLEVVSELAGDLTGRTRSCS